MTAAADVLVLGAGMAGLTAARALTDSGRSVVVVDKGYTPGGRMATRNLGEATFDHGAQFFTARSDAFAAEVASWVASGLARPWFRGSPDLGVDPAADGHQRYAGTHGMRSICEHLADGIDVMTSWRAHEVAVADGTVRLRSDDGRALAGRSLIVTAPVPQAMDLLARGGVELGSRHDILGSLTYDPCIALMVRPSHEPTGLRDGALRRVDGPIAWLGDNRAKGVSRVPAVTIHLSPDASREWWDLDDAEVGARTLAATAEHLPGGGDVLRLQRWRYSAPTSRHTSDCLEVSDSPAIVLAGDAFTGGRVEGAYVSGRAAATRLLGR